MKISKNGFTLIELLATITIMLIITTLVTTSILSIKNKNTNKQYNEYINQFVAEAKNYTKDNKNLVIENINTTGYYNISLKMLYDGNYLDDIPINPNTNEKFSSNSGVKITRVNENLEYQYIENLS